MISYEDLKNYFDSLMIKKAPLTFLQIINKTYDEVIISKLVAYILDERNTSKNVIKDILKKLYKDSEDDFVELLETGIFESIKTEEQISDEDRIDIIIKYNNFWVVIENKINAYESKENQTIRYEKYINKINYNNLPVKYIYLKPLYNKSNPSNKNFSILHYGDLVEILKKYLEELENKDITLYIKDFIKHIEVFLMKDNSFDYDEKAVNFYIENKEKIDYLVDNYKVQCLNTRNLLVESIKSKFTNFLVHDTSSYIQIYKDFWENKGSTGIHIELIAARTSYDLILGDKQFRIRFAVHNEKNTKEKYVNIIQKSLFSKEYPFDNSDNIQKSIKNILEELEIIIDKYENIIDTEILTNNKLSN